ncbi:MAG: SRPBCC family protein, partial [Gaiellales bacterium]
CPVSEVYNQWTQFEEFPRFMGAIKQVQQTDDTHLHWKANIAGHTAEWDAEITEQVPDQVIAWQATDGVQNQGRVQFQQDGDAARVRLEMEVEPQGVAQSVGDVIALQGQVRQDLDRFKQLIESRGQASGEWRGEVHGGDTQ